MPRSHSSHLLPPPAVCAMFSEYCAVPYEIEPVEVVDAFGKSTGAWRGVRLGVWGWGAGPGACATRSLNAHPSSF